MLITELQSGGLHFVLDKDDAGRARLIHFSTKPFDRENYKMENYSSFHIMRQLFGPLQRLQIFLKKSRR